MEVKEGLIPTILGAAVTTTGAVMTRKSVVPKVAAGIVGFGLAHIVLGTIEIVQNR